MVQHAYASSATCLVLTFVPAMQMRDVQMFIQLKLNWVEMLRKMMNNYGHYSYCDIHTIEFLDVNFLRMYNICIVRVDVRFH